MNEELENSITKLCRLGTDTEPERLYTVSGEKRPR